MPCACPVARVYRSLTGKGYLRAVLGKGVCVSDSPSPRKIRRLFREGAPERDPGESLSEQCAGLVWRAKMLGLPVADVAAMFDGAMHKVYPFDHVCLMPRKIRSTIFRISFALDQQSLDFLRCKVEQAAHERLAVGMP